MNIRTALRISSRKHAGHGSAGNENSDLVIPEWIGLLQTRKEEGGILTVRTHRGTDVICPSYARL